MDFIMAVSVGPTINWLQQSVLEIGPINLIKADLLNGANSPLNQVSR
jgi:hypothetical protein